jgi:hypothetical protein
MTRSVTFNGITMFRPGGLTRVNANALNQIGLATNGIIGIIGEADGGAPNVLTTIDDPALAKEKFYAGPLADCQRVVFNPSTDPRVPGGAFRTISVKVNQGTQAALTLYQKVASDTAAAGSSTTLINLTTAGLTVDAHKTNLLRIGTETRPITSNAAGTVTVSPAFSSAPATGTTVEFLAPQQVLTSKDYGSHTNGIKYEYEPGASSGQAWTTAFNSKSQISDDFGGKAIMQVEYTGSAAEVVRDTGTGDATSTVTSIVDLTKTWTASAFVGFMAEVTDLTIKVLRKISANTSTALTVTALTNTPATEPFRILTGMVHQGTVASGAASTVTLEAGVNVAVNELAGLVVVITAGTGVGQKRIVASNTAGVSPVLTLTNGWTTQPTAGSTYQLRYATSCLGSILGSGCQATGFKTMLAVNGGIAAQDLNLTFTVGQTLQQLVDTINAQVGYQAWVGTGINGQTTLVKDFDFDNGATGVELRQDRSTVLTPPSPSANVPLPWANCFRQDLKAAIDSINATNQLVTSARAGGTGLGAGSGRPEFTGGGVTVVGDVFQYLSGGTRGISTTQNWQDGFDLLLTTRCNAIVMLMSEDLANEGLGSTATFASVCAQMASHLSVANGIGKSERGGYIGMKGTKDQIIAKANQLNNADIQLSCQEHMVMDVDGNLVWRPAWVSAVMAAGMRAGMPEVGEPLTHKYLGTYGMRQDSSWDPADRTDANQFIQAGILFAETISGKGTRWVRDITTYVIDDNMAYMEGSVRDVVRYVSYGHRTILEDRFTGVKATPTNAAGIKDTGSEFLEQCRSQNIIVDSTDPRTGAFVKAFHNYRVSISGDIATIRVEIFPVVGINFQLNDIYLQLPSQAA